MLFQWLFCSGRPSEMTLSLLPVSSHTVLSSVKPCSHDDVGVGPVVPHGTVTSTEKGMPSKPGTVPDQRV